MRISGSTEENTSIERQRQLIENWADANGHEIIGWAEDIDLSGSVSPFDALELGPWFKEPKVRRWDALVAWKLDRIARRSVSLHQVFSWMEENDKTLVCISDNIDLSNWVGRLVASVIAGVAEGDLEAITERIKAGKRALREKGRWAGGQPLYGYTPVRLDEGGWGLALDPEEQVVLQRMIGGILEGRSASSIAKEFNAEGIPTIQESRYGRKSKRGWTGDAIRQTLRSKALLGWTTHETQPILDQSGKPVLKGPPSVDQETFNRLQAALDTRTNTKANADKTSPLLHVLKCWHCEEDMHVRRSTLKSGKVHTGYHCSSGCDQIVVNGDVLHPMVEDLFLQELGDHSVLEKETVYATDYSRDLAEAKAAYDDISRFLASAPNAEARQTLFNQLETVGNRIRDLEAAPQKDEVRWKDTGQRYSELWKAMDEEERRQLMLRSGLTVRAQQLTKGTRHGPGILEVELVIPEDLRERLA